MLFVLLIFMALLNINGAHNKKMQKTTTKEYTYKGHEETFEVHGKYKFELYGAQGGGGFLNGVPSSLGGEGAYAYGDITFENAQILTVSIGRYGADGPVGPNQGGWPNGGNGGEDTGAPFGTADDGPGGGGGSSSLYLGSTKLLIAAGGSGGVMGMNGCNGGGFGVISCPVAENMCSDFDETSQYGIASGYGGDGKSANEMPGSGGGGGNYGGIGGNATLIDAYVGMGCSGSSYFNPKYINNYGLKTPAQRYGSGLLRVTAYYECMEECEKCNSSNECISCPAGKYMKLSRCVSSCGDGFYPANKACQKCSSLCKTCTNTSYICTSCNENQYLDDSKCVSECPSGKKPINGTCQNYYSTKSYHKPNPRRYSNYLY